MQRWITTMPSVQAYRAIVTMCFLFTQRSWLCRSVFVCFFLSFQPCVSSALLLTMPFYRCFLPNRGITEVEALPFLTACPNSEESLVPVYCREKKFVKNPTHELCLNSELCNIVQLTSPTQSTNTLQ